MTRPVAIVTGAAQGIGLEVAQRARRHPPRRAARPQRRGAAGRRRDLRRRRAPPRLRHHRARSRSTDADRLGRRGGRRDRRADLERRRRASRGALRHLDPDTLAAVAEREPRSGTGASIHACLPHIERAPRLRHGRTRAPSPVITGAAQGIGLEAARTLSSTHRVALLDLNARGPARTPPRPAAPTRSPPSATSPRRADRRRRSPGRRRRPAASTWSISNAGIAVGWRPAPPRSRRGRGRQLNVNLVGNWRTIHACLPHIDRATRLRPRGRPRRLGDRAVDRPRPVRDEQGGPRDAARHPARRGRPPRRRRRRRVLPLDQRPTWSRRRPRDGGVRARCARSCPARSRTTHPVGDAAQAIVAACTRAAERSSRPGGSCSHRPRMVLRTRAGERDARAGAPSSTG